MTENHLVDPAYRIEKNSLVDQICSKMKENILTGVWKEGSKISCEADLSAKFGVNRSTIRSALQRMNALGLLDTRVGEGTYVLKFNFCSYMDEISAFYINDAIFEKLYEYRKAIELTSAKLAIDSATPGQVNELSALVNNYELHYTKYLNLMVTDGIPSEVLAEEFDTLVESDISFHEKVCEISNNPWFSYAFAVCRPAIIQYIKKVLRLMLDYRKANSCIQAEDGDNFSQHMYIYEGIQKRDFSLCEKAFENMLGYKEKL